MECIECGDYQSDYCRECVPQYETLDPKFLEMMDQVGKYGRDKYGNQSFDVKAKNGTLSRDMDRVKSHVIAQHAHDHMLDGVLKFPHDHFGNSEYNLAAAAFNAMMEFVYQQAEKTQ